MFTEQTKEIIIALNETENIYLSNQADHSRPYALDRPPEIESANC